MAKGLDEILGEAKPKAETPVEKPEQPKVEAKPELTEEALKAETPEETKPDKPRDEQGKFIKGEKAAETPAAKPDKPKSPEAGLEAGIAAERRKRQAAESQSAEYQRQLQALQQPRKAPDVLEDPDGFRKTIESDVQQRLTDERVNMSAAWARTQLTDFDEVMQEWPEMTRENPLLYQQAVKQELPAMWAYQHVKRERFLKEVGDNPDAWRNKEREKLRAELEPELKKQLESSMPKPVAPTPSLASATSGGNATQTEIARKPFSKIFGS